MDGARAVLLIIDLYTLCKCKLRVCVCVCVYIYIYIYICTCICSWLTYIHTCIYMHNRHKQSAQGWRAGRNAYIHIHLYIDTYI